MRAIRYCVSALDANIGDTHTHVPGTFRKLGRGCLAGLHPEQPGPSKRPCLRFRTFQWRSQSLPMEGPLMLRVEFKGKTQKLPGGERSNLLVDLRCPSQTKAQQNTAKSAAKVWVLEAAFSSPNSRPQTSTDRGVWAERACRISVSSKSISKRNESLSDPHRQT